MTIVNKATASRDIIGRLGFDFLAHLEAMRSKGVDIIDVNDSSQASVAALRTWEDTNYPYRLPEDLRAFLSSTDGFCLSWTTKLQPREYGGGGGGGDRGASGPRRDVIMGRVRVNRLSAISRVPLDADDLRSIRTSSSSKAAATGATAGATNSTQEPCLQTKNGVNDPNLTEIGRGRGCNASTTENDDHRGGCGVAAFSLDSACEVGRVALLYGAERRSMPILHRAKSSSTAASLQGTSASNFASMVANGLENPEVWMQDLSCRWHFLADSFTSYFRMMVVHLGILGWQQAFSPVGLSPATEKCMRLYCPDRLLFDQLEWQKERASRRAARETSKQDSGADRHEGSFSAGATPRSSDGGMQGGRMSTEKGRLTPRNK